VDAENCIRLGDLASPRSMRGTWQVCQKSIITCTAAGAFGNAIHRAPEHQTVAIRHYFCAALLAACLSAHQTMINGNVPCAARLSRSVLDWLPPLGADPRRTLNTRVICVASGCLSAGLGWC
jgi:hypothetical protein